MKTQILSTVTLTGAVLSPQSFGQDLFESFDKRHIEGVGLILFDSNCENFWDPVNLVAHSRAELNGSNRWNPVLFDKNSDEKGFENRFVVALRLQDAIDKAPKDAESAMFSYTGGDRGSFSAKGALVLDVYAPSNFRFFGYNEGERNFGFHFRFGAEFDRGFGGDQDAIDNRRYFAGFNFLAPVLDEDGFRGAAASKIDFGYVFQENQRTGESSDSIVVEWRPSFQNLFGKEIELDGFLKNPTSIFSKKDESSESSNSDGDKQATSSLDPNNPGNENTGTSFSIQPRFEFDAFLSHATGRDDGVCGCAGVDVRFVTLERRLRLEYSYDFSHSFGENESFGFHEISANYALPISFKDVTLSASYLSGERAPDFVDEELFTVGMGLQF